MSGSRGNNRELLCEGAEGACEASVVYVQQGGKTLFLRGKPDVSESFDNETQVVESLNDLDLVEEKGAGGKTIKTVKNGTWTFEGVGQRSDVKNQNGRVYPRKIWEKLIADEKSPVQEAIQNKRMVGHLEHPSDGKSDGKEGAIVTTEAKLLEDGTVWHKGEILDTPSGLILQEYAMKGIPWGTSTRGSGTVHEDGTVDEDYALKTWDAVLNPSTPGAFPDIESPNGGKNESAQKTIEHAKQITSLDESSTEFKQTAAREFVRLMGDVTSHAADGSISKDTAFDLTQKLGEKLTARQNTEIDESSVNECSEMTELQQEAVEQLARRTRSLHESLIHERRRAESLALRANAHERSYDQAEAEKEELREQLDEANNRVEEMISTLEQKETELNAARESLANPSESRSAVQVAVDEAIERDPSLAKHRDVLEQAETVTEVIDRASKNEQDVTEERSRPEPMLPRGSNMKSEGVEKPRTTPASDISEGARIASALVNS